MKLEEKEKIEKTRYSKNNDKSKTCILGERNGRYHEIILSNTKSHRFS